MKKGLFLLLFFSICHNFLGQEALQGEKIRRISFKEEPIPEPTIVKLDENTTSTRGTSFRAASAGRSGSISDVMTQGELSVSGTGGASYTLPISVPQGLQGIVPTISINYNSQGGNGMAGYGWNVSGISVISRTGSTMYHDKKISGVDFSENDRFLLDGQRLILKTGQYGKDGATYQTENFSHIKIKSVGVSPYGASYGAKHFEVLYPDGSKAYYGLTDDSHSHTDYAISYWENPQGIRITYHYLKSGNRSFIQKITYGKKGTIGDNEVRFLYKNRTRKEFAYVGGIRFENTLLLDKIQSFSKGQEYRTYTLGYGGKHNSLGYDRLISVQESIGYNYKDPIYFYYSNTQSSVTPKQASYNISSLGNITDYNTKCLSLDLDGDRLSDFVLYPKMGDDAFKKVYLFDDFRKENPNSHNFPFSVNLEKFTQLFSGKILVGQDKNIYIDNDALFSVHQDYNKIKIKSYVRGVVAPLYFQYEKEWNLPVYYERDESWCDKNTNPTPNEPMPLMPRYEGTEKYVPVEIFDGDFNGDGLTDVLAVERNYNIQDCQPNHRDRPPRILDSPHYDSFDDCRCNSYTAGGYSVHWIDLDTRKTSNYSSLVGNLSKRFDSGVLKAIDITGNGKTNLVHITNGEILVYEFNNNNHLELLWRYTHSRIQARMPFIQGDYNGDGKIDFLVPIENNSNRFVMFYNTGKGFEPSENNYPFTFRETFSEKKEKKSGWFLWKEITRYSIYHQYGLLAIDINNDGKTDIIDTYFNRVPDEFPEEKREGFFAIYENEALNFRKTAQQNFPYDDLTPHIITMNSDRRDIYTDILSVSRNTIKSFHFNKDSGTEVRLSAVSHRYDIDRNSNNNYGNEGKITYKISYDRLTERFDYYSHDRKPLTIYQKSYEERFPYIDVGNVPSMFVVSKIQREGGRVPEAEQQFRYAGAVSHMSGLGFLGFTSVGRTNWYSKNNEYGEALYTHTIMNPHLKGAVIQDFTTHSINNYGIIPIHNYIQKNEYNYENQTDSHKIFRLKLTQKQSEDKITGVTSLERFSYDDDMNPVRQEITMGTTQKIVETSYVSKSVNPYLVGRVASQKTSSTIDGDTFTTEEQYVYKNNLVTSKKIRGHDTDFKTEKYSYDDVGNIIRKEIIAENGESRREDMEYDTSKRFLVKHIDFEGGTTYKYDDYKGTLQEEINDLGQKTKYEYDVWGRPTRVTDFLGKSVHTYYYSSSSGNSIETTSDDGSYNKESYNALGLLETSVIRNPFDRDVIVKYQYDAQGRVIRQSLPYFDGHSPKWIETSYDRYGRVTQTSHPTGKVTRFTYNGLATTVVDGEKTTTTTKNASGQTIKQEDLGGVITYSYFGNGNLKNANYQGALQQISQDGWGRKTALNDPSAGNYTYQYDVWGRIIQENTPQGSTSYKYDNVTELLQEKHITGNGTDMRTTYAYNFDRLLTRVSLTNADGNNEEYHYQYNPNKQIETLTETKQGGSVTFTKKFFYNEFGDIAEQEYTANAYGKDVFTHIFYDYNYGYLTAIRNKGDVVWELNDVNEYGQPISITKGKTTEKFQYDDSFLTYHSVSTDFGLIEEKSYHFDKAKGLLNHRLYSFNAERENFGYDNLERLVSWTDKGKTQTHIYDERGRITQNSLVGQYTYENHKYQQKALKTNELGNAYYDQYAVPNVRYNAFKSPIEIKVDSPKQKEVISYQYDAFGGRSASYYGGLEPDKTSRRFEKHYSHNGSFEVKKDKHTGKITFLVYLDGDAYSAHSVYRAEDDNKDYLYLHRDYLGSITSITDSEGKTLEKRHFNAWGEITKYWNAQGQTTIPAEGILLDRGYTGHEHLLSVGLIHMNGRLYDPVLHRFLQPDNYIQDPFNTQNFNRYGYVLNNPLLYTDPSGEFWHIVIGAVVGGVVNLVANVNTSQGFWEHFAAFGVGALGGAVTAAVGGADGGASFLAITGTAAAASAITAGTNSIIAQTGPNFKGMNGVNWNDVGKNMFVGGLAGFAGSSAGIWAANSNILVNGISSPVLRSVVASPISAGAGHIVGGTAWNLLEGQNFGDAFENSFNGLGQSMALGLGVGVTTTIATSYANGINPWSGTETEKRVLVNDQPFEIGEGVRRTFIVNELGYKTILSTDDTGRLFRVPIKNLYSPMKSSINNDIRYQNLYKSIKIEGQKFPIYVQPGKRGIPAKLIKLNR